MGLIRWPSDLPEPFEPGCAICGATPPFDAISVGCLDRFGGQAFACEAHFDRKSTFIIGWANFLSDERGADIEQMVQLAAGESDATHIC